MEAPLSKQISNNELKNQSNSPPDDITEIKIIKEKFEYKIILSIIENQIKIEAKLLNSIAMFYYIGIFNLEDLIKINNYFKCLDNIKEVKDLIIEGNLKNKIEISSFDNEKKELHLILNFISGFNENKIDFILKRKELDKEDIILVLTEKIIALEKENQTLKSNFNIFENDYKELKIEFEEMKKWKKKYEKELDGLMEIKKNQEALKNIDSKIIKTKEELKLIDDRIKNNDPIFMKKNVKYTLLYRGTRDGDQVSTFHKKCDNKKPTISIIKTKKGMRFGGYTEQTWNDNNGQGIWKQDDKAFCFSLELNKIYNIIPGKDAIYCCSTYMCYFGSNIFGLYNGAFSRDNWAYSMSDSNYSGQQKDFELTNEKSNSFQLAEVEVFEISFD